MKKCFTPNDKIRKVMKICSIQAIIAITLCSLALAHDNYGQVLDKKITISLKEVSIEEALEAIEELTYVKFFYSVDQLGIKGRVSIEAVDKSLGEILDELLSPYRIKYTLHEKKSTITLKKVNTDDQSDLLFPDKRNIDMYGDSFQRVVSGIIRDAATQQPMAGVNILIKGTTTGTSSDANGQFSIGVSDSDVLVFSFIGYKIVEVPLNGRTMLEIVMKEDAAMLKEVTLNGGYYTTTDRAKTGNISKVTAKEISRQPVANALQTLQGRMPGVVITQSSGVTGSGMRVQIRGQNSLRNTAADNGNLPLYVIDGVPFVSKPFYSYGLLMTVAGVDPLSTLNPANIESIEVLKDADATAIYGSRGANGVVLITTKQAGKKETHVDLGFYSGVGAVSNTLDLMNTEQYLAMRREAFANANQTPQSHHYDVNGKWDTTRNIDWQKRLFGGTASITDAHGTVSMGNGNTNIRLGGGFHKETTVFPNDFGYERINAHLNMNHRSPDQRLVVTLSLNYGFDMNRLFDKDIVRDAVTLAPNAPEPYDKSGKLHWEDPFRWTNPYSYFQKTHDIETNNLISNVTLSYNLFPNTTLKTGLGYNNLVSEEIINNPAAATHPLYPFNSTLRGNMKSSSWIIEPQIVYSNSFGNSNIEALLGSTWQNNSSENLAVVGTNFANDNLLGNLSAAGQVSVGAQDYTRYKYNAVFGRFAYSWKEKYFLNITGRRDGSSRFGPNQRYANFGAIGVAWIFSEEPFLREDFPFWTFGKLRASFGTTGSDQIGNYGYLDTYTSTNTNYQGTPGLIPTTLANPNYAWEVNKKLEFSMDLGFIEDRIIITGSWYLNRSSNQLVGYTLPRTTGFSSVIENLDATVENQGWEMEISTVNVKTNSFGWNTSFNITLPKNRLIEFPNLAGTSYANTYVLGKPLTILKLYEVTNVDPVTGLYSVKDFDNNGSISALDRQLIVNTGRNYYGGVQNTITYRSFEFDFFLEFVSQSGRNRMSIFTVPPGFMSNQPVEILNSTRWQAAGAERASIQKFSTVFAAYTQYDLATQSFGAHTDASFIRVKNISLSYWLPATVVQRLKLSDARMFVQSQNLLTFTDFVGLDPETSGTSLPPLRIITAGLELKF